MAHLDISKFKVREKYYLFNFFNPPGLIFLSLLKNVIFKLAEKIYETKSVFRIIN